MYVLLSADKNNPKKPNDPIYGIHCITKSLNPPSLTLTQRNTMTKKHGKCWYSQADLGLGINLTGSGGFCCVPAFHPSRLQLTSIHTRLHTYTHTHTALSSRVSSCLANAVQIEGAIHLLTVPKSKGEKHVGQTNSQP